VGVYCGQSRVRFASKNASDPYQNSEGKPAVSDALKNEQIVKCPRCDRTYRLGYSDNEWNKIKDWLKLAQAAIRKDHDLRHEAATIPLEWKGIWALLLGQNQTVSRGVAPRPKFLVAPLAALHLPVL
jgi:uncharacterized C2H2 Zn-finger protein